MMPFFSSLLMAAPACHIVRNGQYTVMLFTEHLHHFLSPVVTVSSRSSVMRSSRSSAMIPALVPHTEAMFSLQFAIYIPFQDQRRLSYCLRSLSSILRPFRFPLPQELLRKSLFCAFSPLPQDMSEAAVQQALWR